MLAALAKHETQLGPFHVTKVLKSPKKGQLPPTKPPLRGNKK